MPTPRRPKNYTGRHKANIWWTRAYIWLFGAIPVGVTTEGVALEDTGTLFYEPDCSVESITIEARIVATQHARELQEYMEPYVRELDAIVERFREGLSNVVDRYCGQSSMEGL